MMTPNPSPSLRVLAEQATIAKPLVWYAYDDLPHEYGRGSWEATGTGPGYQILDVGTDPKNGKRYYLRGWGQFETLVEAQTAAQTRHEASVRAIVSPALLDEIEALRKALEPFAEWADAIEESHNPHEFVWNIGQGDLRDGVRAQAFSAARAALNGEKT